MKPLILMILLMEVMAAGETWVYAEELAPALNAHIEKRVQAINDSDRGSFLETVYPASLAGRTKENHDYFEDWIVRELAYEIPSGYSVTLTEMDHSAPLWLSDQFDYPVRPTHWITVDYDKSPSDSVSLFWQAGKYDGIWYEVVPLPKEEMLASIKQARAQSKQQKAEVQKAYRSLDRGLRRELEDLLAAGNKIAAIKHYRAVKGVPLSFAKDLIEKLEIQKSTES